MMNGISLVISKPCCPVHSFGTINKIKFGTSNKRDLIPCRFSNLLHQRISYPVATKPMLKHHRVYSSYASKDVVTGSTSEAPEASSTVVPYFLVAGLLGIIGLSLLKASKVAVQFILTKGGFEGVAAFFVARWFLGNIMSVLSQLDNRSLFSIGDKIEVGHLKGEVTKMGLITTSLVTEENRRTKVATSWRNGQEIMTKSRAKSYPMESEICMSVDKTEKIAEISEEIRNMMRSSSIIYLEREQPFCYLSELDPLCVTLTYGCNLKQVDAYELSLAEVNIILNASKIMKKHGATEAARITK